MKGKRDIGLGIFLVVVLLSGSISSRAQEASDPRASLTAQWWQYAISVPASVNPLLDDTGADCMVGQHDPIWFLAGNFLVGGKIKRTCAVPAGEWLFFPVINSVQINVPNVCGQAGSLSVAQLRALAATAIDAATNMPVEVDGKEVSNPVRIKSDVFATVIPADNIFNLPYVCGPGTVSSGVYSRSVDDGYYVLLKPLSVGDHLLQFKSESGDFKLDVTYLLHVGGTRPK
jgi:hypothetical protein